jgi:hypothetical protein
MLFAFPVTVSLDRICHQDFLFGHIYLFCANGLESCIEKVKEGDSIESIGKIVFNWTLRGFDTIDTFRSFTHSELGIFAAYDDFSLLCTWIFIRMDSALSSVLMITFQYFL